MSMRPPTAWHQMFRTPGPAALVPRPRGLDRQPSETDHLEHQMAMRPDNPASGFDSAEGDAEQAFGH